LFFPSPLHRQIQTFYPSTWRTKSGWLRRSERLKEIKELTQAFCGLHLNEELAGYALKLCGKLRRKRTLSIIRGKKEIWSASIVYVIARLDVLQSPVWIIAFFYKSGMLLINLFLKVEYFYEFLREIAPFLPMVG
jgi:hypothetical protein